MRLRGQDRTITSAGMTNEVVPYTIKQDAKMFRILVDKLYSNKPEAVVRELLANAYDAMVAAGKATVPFTIHLPTFLEPWLTVKDTGIGLSDTAVKTVYTCIGESLKNNTNLLIGGLGLGCKSPLSYTDSFTVTSTYNGERRIYSVYLDSEGHPQLTQVGDVIYTHDCNGIEVQMPVKEQDEYDFRKAVEKYASYYPTHPVVNNSVDLKLVNYTSVLEGAKWRLLSWEQVHRWNTSKEAPLATAVMGHVPYPLDFTALKQACDATLYDEIVQPLSNYSIQLTFDIGDLDVSASRESLSYDPTTVANIVEVFKNIGTTLNKEVQDKIDEADTLWEAYKNYQEMKHINQIAKRLSKSAKTFKWKGQDYPSHTINVDYTKEKLNSDTQVYLIHPSRFTSYKTIGSMANYIGKQKWVPKVDSQGDKVLDSNGDQEHESRYFMDIGSPHAVFVWIDPSRAKQYRIPSRLHSWMQQFDPMKSLFIIETSNVLDRDRIYAAAGNPPNDIRYVFHDDVPDIKVVRTVTNSQGQKVQIGTNEFTPKLFSYQSWSSYGSETVHWRDLSSPINLDLSRGYYVDIRKGAPQAPKLDNYGSSRSLSCLLSSAESMAIVPVKTVVYGCDGSRKNKMKDHSRWDNFFTFMDTQLRTIAQSSTFKDYLDKERAYEDYLDYKGIMNELGSQLSSIKDPVTRKEVSTLSLALGSAGRDASNYMSHFRSACEQLRYLHGTECDAKKVLDKLVATVYTPSILTRFPLLTTLSHLTSTQLQGSINGVVDYLNSK